MFEKVNPQHPDKVADRIAGAIVDLAYSRAFSRSGISKGPWYAARSIEALSYTKSEWPTVAAYALIDFSYHIQWHIAALLLRGTGGAILMFIGMVIKEIEEK